MKKKKYTEQEVQDGLNKLADQKKELEKSIEVYVTKIDSYDFFLLGITIAVLSSFFVTALMNIFSSSNIMNKLILFATGVSLIVIYEINKSDKRKWEKGYDKALELHKEMNELLKLRKK